MFVAEVLNRMKFAQFSRDCTSMTARANVTYLVIVSACV